MKAPPSEAIPVIDHVDGIESFDLKPEEAFVFSRVNGKSSLAEICQILGWDLSKVWALLERLVMAKYVRIEKAAPKPAKGKGKPKSSVSTKTASEKPVSAKAGPGEERAPEEEIEGFLKNLGGKNHYQILGLSAGAKSKEIRRRYFNLVKKFHPDRFHRSNLGIEKERAEEIFKKITAAFEVLSDEKQRKVYDRDLVIRPSAHAGAGSESKGSRSSPEAVRYFVMGQQEEEAGNFHAAASFYQLATHMDPKDLSYKRALSNMRAKIRTQSGPGSGDQN